MPPQFIHHKYTAAKDSKLKLNSMNLTPKVQLELINGDVFILYETDQLYVREVFQPSQPIHWMFAGQHWQALRSDAGIPGIAPQGQMSLVPEWHKISTVATINEQ